LLDKSEKAQDLSKFDDEINYEFDLDMTKRFKSFIGHLARQFENISGKRDQWQFFDIAIKIFYQSMHWNELI